MAKEAVTFALGIPHTPWRPERVESFERLQEQLGSCSDEYVRVFSDREPNWSWSSKMWRWATETDASHFLTLQDDAIVAPDFWRHLRNLTSAVPDQIIGLESVHPASQSVPGCWYRTPDCLIGVGYVVPMQTLRDFLEWRSKLRKGAIETITEDTMLGLYAMHTGRGVWHPVPTIIDHDTELPSTYDNDAHMFRRPLVTWDHREIPRDWTPREVTALPRFYKATPKHLRRWVVGATEEDFQRWLAM
jgi:hypothetical protein